jgi:HEPN domain-containing protein
MRKMTAEWVRKAEADYVIARAIRRLDTAVHDGVCFHCQQLSEKYLKGLMEEAGLMVSKTHDLTKLLAILLPKHPSLGSLRRGLHFLSDFAVDTRYPGNSTTKRQALSAWRGANKVRAAARVLLGLPLVRARSRKNAS